MRQISSLIAMALLLILATAAAAVPVSWIDWQSTTSGSLTIDSTSVNVSLTGNPWDLVNGDYYYNNASTGYTSPTGTYGGLQPSDLIRVTGTGTFSLNFDTPVVDPYIALVSVGAFCSHPVTYRFNSPITVISTGPNYWGYCGYSISGNDFIGREFNGILQFHGTYSAFSFDVLQPEGWHGFNLGVAGVASGGGSSIPEPATLSLFGLGLLALAFRRR